MSYDAEFFEAIRAGAQQSAAAVVPLVAELLAPASVVDVGCGEGWWGKAFEDAGAEVLGLDGSIEQAVISCTEQDLREPIDLGREFDLAVCLEVAEHLPDLAADGLVGGLCRLAPIVLFSAAIPGQGGTHHVNERWPGYWVERFLEHGYTGSGALRWRFWDDDRVKPWYRQNLLVFASETAPRARELFPPDGCPAVVHPAMWRHHGYDAK